MQKILLHLSDPDLPKTTIWDSVNPIPALQAMRLMDSICDAIKHAPESYIKTGLLTSPAPDIQKVRELKQMIEDNCSAIESLIGEKLINQVKAFGI